MTPEERNRGRLAKSFSAFWDGGAGPTHGDLVSIFAQFEFPEDAIQGSKKDRVGAAVRHARDDELLALVDELLDSLRRASNVFDLPRPDADPWKRDVEQLGKALAAYGLHLTDEGDLDRNATALPLRPANKLPDVPALREHIHRLDIAAQYNDIPLLLGTSKELLETTCKVVLDVVDVVAPEKFPSLVAAAFEALRIHPKSPGTAGQPPELAEAVRKILGGMLQIALGINDLRNDHGTGHGRLGPAPRLGPRHARLTAGASVMLTTFLLDTLEDPKAPWRTTTDD